MIGLWQMLNAHSLHELVQVFYILSLYINGVPLYHMAWEFIYFALSSGAI